MPWAKFTKDFSHDFRPQAAQVHEFKAGETRQVPRGVLNAAIEAGAATESKPAAKKSVKRKA